MENSDFDEKAKDYVEPKDFKNLIGEKNPLFKVIKANDSKDLIILVKWGLGPIPNPIISFFYLNY